MPPKTVTNADVIINDISHIKEDITEIKTLLEKNFVTTKEFNPVRAIAYGLVGTICLAVIGALIALVVV